jgi:Holliday junction resolvasome RuvABC endonuclease subunit
MKVVGIDYSMTCPCVCVSTDREFASSYFHFLHNDKRYQGQVANINGDPHDEYLCDQQRYENIASWVLSIICNFKKEEVFILIEDYAFAAKGRVFNIAENCGLLKYLLYKEGYRFSTIAPSVIKKAATGKGNANKEAMYAAFYELTNIDLVSVYSPKTKKLASPVTDIVDSFYLARWMHDSLLEKK